MVRTAKYEFYNFLPKFLWEEFNPATKIANVYFLFIAALQASRPCCWRILRTGTCMPRDLLSFPRRSLEKYS